MTSKVKRRKKMLRAAGKAPAWLLSVAAPDRGTARQRERHKMKGFLKSQGKAPVHQYTREEIAAFVAAGGAA